LNKDGPGFHGHAQIQVSKTNLDDRSNFQPMLQNETFKQLQHFNVKEIPHQSR